MSALFLAIPLTIFMLFVAPIWLWLHYSQRKNSAQLGQNDLQRLTRLTEESNRMRERIRALEDILDTEHPDWRKS
ncbi:envelope stress response membrane protein PspB [Pectobacterium actinidiae]|uniref:envelope stress response membrane protein PspB n=1 Tax=Pectobacterium actinidiae TaxID=1507808 RepID=UPI001198A776|nr:envelope stress response membrane protein PspB [Pectobacterium actinidiae]QDX97362.1 envelope stress response membrane protein PspB [Pectobacterium carotovorum subsp. carotovorum]WEF10366.1 envelope stress response membrane protein PspB [Pectobacterium actinidiae]GLW37632.1 phage shock protein B [Pectobacterium carotovorum subsp. carotovorum]